MKAARFVGLEVIGSKPTLSRLQRPSNDWVSQVRGGWVLAWCEISRTQGRSAHAQWTATEKERKMSFNLLNF